MSISGHKTREIFDRYNIVSEQDVAEALSLQRHLSMSTKFAHVESRFCGHKQPGKTVFYTPINLCVRKHVYRSVVVGLLKTQRHLAEVGHNLGTYMKKG